MPAIALMGAFLLLGSSAPSLPVPALFAPPALTVTLTGYNAVPAQTDASPSTTANGGPSNPSVVAARSRDLADMLPFGTIIAVDGPATTTPGCGYGVVATKIGYRVITDVMNARFSNYIDILFSTKSNYISADGIKVNASAVLGTCPGTTVRVVGHLDLTHVGDLPKTQEELAALVEGTTTSNLAVR